MPFLRQHLQQLEKIGSSDIEGVPDVTAWVEFDQDDAHTEEIMYTLRHGRMKGRGSVVLRSLRDHVSQASSVTRYFYPVLCVIHGRSSSSAFRERLFYGTN